MSSRQQPDTPEDDVQNAVLQAVHDALNDDAPPPAETEAAPEADAPDTKVEIDRTDTYLKGPTAFSA